MNDRNLWPYPMLKHDREWPVKDRNGRARELRNTQTNDLENGIKSFGASFQRMYYIACVYFIAIWDRNGVRMLLDGKMLEIENLDNLNLPKIKKYPAKFVKDAYTVIANLNEHELEKELRRLWNEVLPGFAHQINLYRAELTFRSETNHPSSFWETTTEEWLKQRTEWATDMFLREYSNNE